MLGMSRRERKESTAVLILGEDGTVIPVLQSAGSSSGMTRRPSVFHHRESDFSVQRTITQRQKLLVDHGRQQQIARASQVYDIQRNSEAYVLESRGAIQSVTFANSIFAADDSDSDDSSVDAASPSGLRSPKSPITSSAMLQGSNVVTDDVDVIKDFSDAYGGDMDTDGPGFQNAPLLPPPLVMEYGADKIHEKDPAMLWDHEYSFDNEEVYKTGWLIKEGRIHKNWKKRWFVLQGSKLSYFTAKNRKLKGTLDLETCIVKTLERPAEKEKDSTREKTKTVLELVTEGRRLYFLAESNSDTIEWYKAIQNKIAAIQYVRKSKALKIAPHARVSAFLNSPDSTHLNFSMEPIRIEAVVALSQLLANHPTIHTIEITHASMDSLCFSILCKALHNASSLRVLDVSYNDITDVSDLPAMLHANRSLQCLALHHNPVGDEGVAKMVRAIEEDSLPLEVCSFEATGCTEEGALAIATHLGSCRSLGVLALSHNRVGAIGAAAIGKMLFEGQSSIVTVDLSFNQLGNDGCIALCERGLGTVRTLDLSHNEIGFTGAHALTKVMPCLRVLIFGGNRMSEQIVRDFVSSDSGSSWTFPDVELVL